MTATNTNADSTTSDSDIVYNTAQWADYQLDEKKAKDLDARRKQLITAIVNADGTDTLAIRCIRDILQGQPEEDIAAEIKTAYGAYATFLKAQQSAEQPESSVLASLKPPTKPLQF